MPLDKAVKLASFQENMLSHKTVFLSLCRSLWEDKLLYTLVPAARLFSRAAWLAISHGTGVSKSCSRTMSFWDWAEYDDFSKVVGLVAKFGARVQIIFAHILVFPSCAIEVQHINENSPTVLLSPFSCLFCLLSSRILQNNLLYLYLQYLVEIRRYKLSFFAKTATNKFRVVTPFEKSLRKAQNSPGAGTIHIFG